MTAKVIELPVLRNMDTDKLLQAFDEWGGEGDGYILGFWHEDVYWELHRRGVAPPI